MSGRSTAIVTASYGPDFERCKILCETVDRHLTGFTQHYILVDNQDAPLFRALEGPKRTVVTDADLLPRWLLRVPGRIAPRGRTVWISHRTVPLHGWHVQQLRRIAIARHAPEDAFFYCDSDTAFTRPFDMSALWQGDRLRLFREQGTADTTGSDHRFWLEHAAKALGEPKILSQRNNYVRTFIAWRRDTVLAMCDRMEQVHKSHWVAVVGTSRKISECTLYGSYAEYLGDADAHWYDDRDFCRIHWFNPPPTRDELNAYVAAMEPHEIGFGVQSFIAVPLEWVRELALD